MKKKECIFAASYIAPMRQILLILFSGSFFLCSCTPWVYYPVKMDAPLIFEKGDLEAGGAIAIGGYNAHAAYAITNDWAIKGDVDYSNNFRTDTSYLKQLRIEGGIGKIGFFESKNAWQTFFLFALCNSDVASPENSLSGNINPMTVKSSYLRFGLQGTIMTNEINLSERKKYSDDINYDHSLNARVTYLHYLSYDQKIDYSNSDSVSYRNTLPRQMFLEFSSISQAGNSIVTIELQIGFILPIFSKNGKYNMNPFLLSAGINFHL